MNAAAIKQLQQSLGLPATGVLDESTLGAMNNAVKTAVASNPDIAKYGGTNSPDAILDAYMTNDWSNVIDLTGKPFTKAQQRDAVTQAEKAYAPSFNAQDTFDRAGVEDTLSQDQRGFDEFRKGEAEDFGINKDAQDLNAANEGVLFSGARFQKLRDLRNTYQDRETQQRKNVEDRMRSTARNYHYSYGDENAKKLSDFYTLPGQSTFNPGVAGGKVTSRGSTSAYDPTRYKFQGTIPVARKAAVQTRAAGLLTNRANKLTSTGYKNQY